MPYIDGFLIPVRNADRDAYKAHELHWWPTFKEMGAQQLVAGWGDDVPPGKHTDFLRAVDLKEDETVVFCWMIWPDKPTRDAAYKKMMDRAPDDPGMQPDAMPFDGKRMVFSGFTPLIMEL